MANRENKYPDNVEGSYFVDEECIACGICISEAENNFKMSDDGSYAFVYKQPENDSEKADCENALESCPVDAIGKDE